MTLRWYGQSAFLLTGSKRVLIDPFGALGLLTSISERVGSLQAQVTDPELLERIGEIQTGWDALVADAQESLGAGDASGLQRAADQVAQLGQQVTELQQFCTGS